MRRVTRSPEAVAAAREQHRLTTGRFGVQPRDEAPLGADGVDLSPAAPVAPLADAVATVREEFTWVDLTAPLFNHSVDSDADMLTLSDMADPGLARNNCDAASQALLVEWGGDAEPVALHFVSTDGEGDRVQHAAIETIQGGHRVVIDITARQFDPDAAFPLVMERAAWEAWVRDRHADLGYAKTQAMSNPVTPADVVVSRDAATPGRAVVRLRDDPSKIPVGFIVANEPEGPKKRDATTGRPSWTPLTGDGVALTYADGTPRRYFSRTHAVEALTRHLTGRPDWENAPAITFDRVTLTQWGHTVDARVTGPLLHASPHRLDVGDILEPDQAPVNFTQSDPFVVSASTEVGTTHQWGREAAKRSGTGVAYVYVLEPLGSVDLHNWYLDGWASRAPVTPGEDMTVRVMEARMPAARIVEVYEIQA